MKLKFEEFIEKQKLSDDINIIFSDSVKCYKNGIYRPSLMMSYVAFLMILRERVLNSNKPHLFKDVLWEKYQKHLTYDLKWESTIYDLTQIKVRFDSQRIKASDPVFNIDDSLRNQILYWRGRRNDCAHYKTNIIDSFHVEAFWAFIESNLHKITIEGGKENLLKKFKLHFDTKYMPKNKDYKYLINEIPYSIEDHDLHSFWKELFTIVESEYFSIIPSDEFFIFLKNVLYNSNESISASMLKYIKTENRLFVSFTNRFPEFITHFNLSETEIRNLWKTKLVDRDTHLNIYATLLNNNLIPQSEISESNNHIAKNLKEFNIKGDLNYILQKNNFNEEFENFYFNENKFLRYQEVNNISDLIISYLKVNDFNLKSTEIIANELNKESYYSEWLERKIKHLFIEHPDKKSKFMKICELHNITIPNRIL